MPLPKCLNPGRSDSQWSPPVDVCDLAIRLETEGISDAVARADFGFEDTWAMAESHFPALSERKSKANYLAAAKTEAPRPLRDYFAGTLFALPLLISCLAILFLRFSLWGGKLPANTAAAIGLGVACSFVASGGFVQAMSRQGLWYLGTGQLRTCAQSTWLWFRRAAMTLLLLGFIGMAISWNLELLPRAVSPWAAAFYFSLSLLWLSLGILYMLRRNLLVAAATLVGIGCAVLLHRGLSMNLLGAQIVSILAAALFALSISMFILTRQARGERDAPLREPVGRTLYYLWPYFTYGCLYYLFLFADRLLAWTARTDASGLTIQFRGSYEAAQDMALFAFIFQVGWVHSATVRFYDRLKERQQQLSVGQADEFNGSLTRYYWQIAGPFVPLALAASGAAYYFAMRSGFFSDALHWKVMAWALAGYIFLIYSLRNVSLLFALSCPVYVLLAIGGACAANISVGYLLSRFVSYDNAVIGFTFGAALFAAISTLYSLRTLRRLDYYYLTSAG